ncbi:DUF4360 domain-containing protein [Streptomyces roseifaciens]
MAAVRCIRGELCRPRPAGLHLRDRRVGLQRVRAPGEKGATGLVRASHNIQGTSPMASGSHQFAGPCNDGWQVSDTVSLDALVYDPCDDQRNLNLNDVLQVNAGTSDPSTTNSSVTIGPADESDNAANLLPSRVETLPRIGRPYSASGLHVPSPSLSAAEVPSLAYAARAEGRLIPRAGLVLTWC